MRSRVRLDVTGDRIRLWLGDEQKQLVREVILYHVARPGGEGRTVMCLGSSADFLMRTLEKVRSDETDFEVAEVHAITAALLMTPSIVLSEESFYEQIGFFREHAIGLGNGLLISLDARCSAE
ncbi:hypothetical protein [Agromyces seonyuensis]|uniref:Uncharacterized protein n=1 Tax=Agromyces seonyuensis TaxID=2662446 RepID=A0A6I4NWV4_9MICO|nr:hypothetical protein [Agromyces seonyuensis]MWB97572.1 hypothetical protein [Agromyces seonyuensis]